MYNRPTRVILEGHPADGDRQLGRILTVGELSRFLRDLPEDTHVLFGDGDGAWEAHRACYVPEICAVQIY